MTNNTDSPIDMHYEEHDMAPNGKCRKCGSYNMLTDCLGYKPENVKTSNTDSSKGGVGVDFGFKGDGLYVIKKQPQVMNIISVPAPKRLWFRLAWSRLSQRLSKTQKPTQTKEER